MATLKQIQFKRSKVAGVRPAPAAIAEGELAINLKDRLLFTKDDTGAIIDLSFSKGGNVDGNIIHTGNYTQTGSYNLSGTFTQTGSYTTTGSVTADAAITAKSRVVSEGGDIIARSDAGTYVRFQDLAASRERGIMYAQASAGNTKQTLNIRVQDYTNASSNIFAFNGDGLFQAPTIAATTSISTPQILTDTVITSGKKTGDYDIYSMADNYPSSGSATSVNNLRTMRNAVGSTIFHEVKDVDGLSWYSGSTPSQYILSFNASGGFKAGQSIAVGLTGGPKGYSSLGQSSIALGNATTGILSAKTSELTIVAGNTKTLNTTATGVTSLRQLVAGYSTNGTDLILPTAQNYPLLTVQTVNDLNAVGDGQTLLGYHSGGKYHHYFRGKGGTNINTAEGLTVTPGDVNVLSGQVKINSADALRIWNTDYGAIFRRSEDSLHIIPTAKGQGENGSISTLRPLSINLATGVVQISNLDIERAGSIEFAANAASGGTFANQNTTKAPIYQALSSLSTAAFYPITKQKNTVSNITFATGIDRAASDFKIVAQGDLNATGTATALRSWTFAKNGDFTSPRRVYAGSAFFNTDGNIAGSIWNKYGGSTNLDAVIGNQTFLKADNLSGIVDRAAAWLNVRPLGSTPLAGDAVNDYDAVTYRQLKNSSGGNGPSMNGVMNYGVGSFHLTDSRAFLQRYEVFSDGQLLNRADYPDLWAFAQLHSPITDSVWLADWAQRGKYSSGNGTTTFRVPDRNGVQPGSIRALFARGDGGDGSNAGEIRRAHLPNITGALGFHGQGDASAPGAGTTLATGGGAMVPQNQIPRYVNGTTLVNANASSYGSINFNAAASNPVYNRYPDLPDEVLPRNFVGVWTIRASGGFTAANTSWSVINADATLPATGTLILGGTVTSEYKVGTTVRLKSVLESYENIGNGNNQKGTRIVTPTGKIFRFTDAAYLGLPPNGVINSENGVLTLEAPTTYLTGGIAAGATNTIMVRANERNEIGIKNEGITTPDTYVNSIYGNWYDGAWVLGGVRGGSTNLDRAQLNVQSGAGAYASYMFGTDGIARAQQWVSISDIRVKEDVKRIENPLEKMKHIKGVSWKLKTNGSIGHGFIAQDLEADFPEAVTVGSDMDMADGTKVEKVKSVDTSGVAAALHHEAILALMTKVEALEAKVVELSK